MESSIKLIGHEFPHLLIIGAQKCGTTTLYDLLKKVPGFCPSVNKETGFFSKNVLYEQGEDWYLRNFAHFRESDITYEATPAYIYNKNAPQRIYSFNRNVKFIVVLREPSARCYSAWNMFRRFNQDRNVAENIYRSFVANSNESERQAISNLLFSESYPPFKQVVIEDLNRYFGGVVDAEPSFVRRGLYVDQVINYLSFFNVDRFLFIEQRELKDLPDLCRKLADFLEVHIDQQFFSESIMSNEGEYVPMDDEDGSVLKELKGFYAPFNERLFELIGRRFDWNDAK